MVLLFITETEAKGYQWFSNMDLGGDVAQPDGLFEQLIPFRLLSFDFRGHGETRPLGEPEKISFATFADDLYAFLDALDLPQAVIGGISMGAAVALNFALRYPQRVLGLILVRPAWLAERLPANLHVYLTLAHFIRQVGPVLGMERFKETETYQNLLRTFPGSAASLLSQFTRPQAEETVVVLERLPRDAPNNSQQDWKAIQVPTLVLANRSDPMHPIAYGELLAQTIPEAVFVEVTARYVDAVRHAQDVRTACVTFLEERIKPRKP